MSAVECLVSIQTTGKVIDLITPDPTHASAYACKDIPLIYTMPVTVPPVGPPGPETIIALTPMLVRSAGALNNSPTLDPSLTNWLLITSPGTLALLAVPIEERDDLPTLITGPFYAILQWIERGVVRPWQPGGLGTQARVVMDPRYSDPPIPEWNDTGTDWLYR